jgi:hypothetical protein
LVLASNVIFDPGSDIIEVEPGQEFVLRFRLRWDIPGELGYFSLGVTWNSPGENGIPSENFTYLGAEAYFDLDGDNLPDDPDNYISIGEALTAGIVAGDARYTVVVDHTAGDSRDGDFNVDLKFRAAGIGGEAHIPTDNHPISIVSTIDVPEGATFYSYSPPNPYITVRVLGRGVAVAISPSQQGGPLGATLSYTVRVTNMGTFDDTYDLTISDSENWSAETSLPSLTISAGDDGITTLSVTIPPDAPIGAEDTITVTAISRENTEIRASDICTARASAVAIVRNVEISISPSYQSGSPGATLRHTVSIKNLGTIEDTFTFVVTSDADWSASIDPSSLTLAAGATGEATLSVTVPPDADEGTSMTVVVKAVSTGDPTVSGSNTCEVVASEETPSPPGWSTILAILIAVAISAGGYALYLIFKGQRKQKRKRVLIA